MDAQSDLDQEDFETRVPRAVSEQIYGSTHCPDGGTLSSGCASAIKGGRCLGGWFVDVGIHTFPA